MSNGVHVQSVQALTDLRAALAQYREAVAEAVQSSFVELGRVRDGLAERRDYWQRMVRQLAEELEVAREAMRACHSIEDANCDREERTAAEASRKLRSAQEQLANIERWIGRISEASQVYAGEARHLTAFLEQDGARATARLEAMAVSLQQYQALQASSAPSFTAGSAADGGLAGHMIGSLIGAMGLGVAAVAVGATNAAGGLVVDGKASGSTVDVRPVWLETINVSDSHVHGPSDFSKVSHDDMVEGFRKLEAVVRPEAEGGATSDAFAARDAREGLDYEHGYQRIYDAFYGTDAIRLERAPDGRSIVVNGYHRLFVARELGLTSVPARVIDLK